MPAVRTEWTVEMLDELSESKALSRGLAVNVAGRYFADGDFGDLIVDRDQRSSITCRTRLESFKIPRAFIRGETRRQHLFPL